MTYEHLALVLAAYFCVVIPAGCWFGNKVARMPRRIDRDER